MSLIAPEWLTKRGGELRSGTAGHSWFLMLDGAPQYKLVATPAGGKFGCHITQTINGQSIESTSSGTNAEDAVRAGLEDLRKALGW